MVRSSPRMITITAAAPTKTITIDHFEDDNGVTVTSIPSGETFHVIGYYRQDSTPLSGQLVYVYRTDASGNPIVPHERSSAYTDTNGKYDIPFAYTVSETTDMYFRAYDAEQAP